MPYDLAYDIRSLRKMVTVHTQTLAFIECLLENEVIKQCRISRKDLESLCDPGKMYIGSSLCEEMISLSALPT